MYFHLPQGTPTSSVRNTCEAKCSNDPRDKYECGWFEQLQLPTTSAIGDEGALLPVPDDAWDKLWSDNLEEGATKSMSTTDGYHEWSFKREAACPDTSDAFYDLGFSQQQRCRSFWTDSKRAPWASPMFLRCDVMLGDYPEGASPEGFGARGTFPGLEGDHVLLYCDHLVYYVTLYGHVLILYSDHVLTL